MSSNTREIKRRIKSVTNIGQITKAMEMVAAAKMKKAQAQALASRDYAKNIQELLKNLLAKIDLDSYPHPLIKRSLEELEKAEDKNLVILVTSDKGLAGALNTNVINKAMSVVDENGKEQTDFISVGKKGSDAIRRAGLNIVAAFEGQDKNISIFDAKPIAEIAVDDFLAGKYSKVFVVYTDFISTLTQKPAVLQLLPFEVPEEAPVEEYVFEPSADEILDDLVERSIEFSIFQALVESSASEHSARMVAMRNANQAAGDLIDDLQLTYNQARQSSITQELSEITSAKMVMEE